MSGRESIGIIESHSSPQGQVTPSSPFLTQILDLTRTSNTPRSQLRHREWHVNAVQRGINMDHGYGMEYGVSLRSLPQSFPLMAVPSAMSTSTLSTQED